MSNLCGWRLALLYMGVLLLAVLCNPAVWKLSEVAQVAPWPMFWYELVRTSLGLTFITPLIWLAIAVASPVLGGICVRQKQWRFVPLCLAVWLISWGALPLARHYGGFWAQRRAGLQRMATRAAPLIQAIDAHCAGEKECPRYLEDLVPKYIAQIPATGAVGYPKFEYHAPGGRTKSDSYELLVKTPIGDINWDVFVYWPHQNYPAQMYGGSVERIGQWAYVHE